MAKSIKLKNNIYWDASSIKDNIRRVTFSIPSNSSKTIHFQDAQYVVLFASKGGYAGCGELWVIHTYGAGTTVRTQINKIVEGSTNRALTYTIEDRNITISNNIDTKCNCSILLLVATGNVTIS